MEQPPADAERPERPRPNAPFPTHAGLDDGDPWEQPAAPRARRTRSSVAFARISETLEVVALALLMFIAVRAVGQNFIVDGQSMQPTFADNQLLIANRLAYLSVDLSWVPGVDTEEWRPFGRPAAGDVVIFRYPRDPDRDFIKRVVASEGQTVAIEHGVVFVNGVPLREPYLIERWAGDLAEQTVPEGMLFVLGDNRGNSSDSRDWGMLAESLVIGRADLRYWPFDQIGLVGHARAEPATTGLSVAR